MNVVTKSVEAAIKPVESDHPNGEFEVVLSTDSLDRDGERLYADEWKQPLPARIQIDGDHSRSVEKTIGSVVPRIEGNKLIGKGTYAPSKYAQEMRSIINDPGTDAHGLRLSVTFSEHKNQKDGGIQRELLNAGFVAIPANTDCVVLASKGAKVDKAEGGLSASGDNPEVPKHDEMVQAIHDAACHLGAQCQNEIEADPGTADGANKSGPTGTVKDGLITDITDKEASSLVAGLPQESAEESAVSAAAEKSAAAETADESAEDAVKAKAAAKTRALAFLIKQNTPQEG